MMKDRSENYKATWEFLDERISNLLDKGQTINLARNLFGAVNICANSLISVLKPTHFDDSEILKKQEELLKNIS